MTAALKPAPLYLIADEYSRLLDVVAENGGEITPELAAALEAGTEQIKTKVERIVRYIRNREALATAKQTEAKRLREDADTDIRVAENLSRYLLAQLDAADIQKIETPIGTLRVTTAPRPRIRWNLTADEIPGAFQRITVSLDGAKAYETWKEFGGLPDGFTVEHTKYIKGI